MKGVEICLLGCYGLMTEVFGLDRTAIAMMERASRTLKVKRAKTDLHSFLQLVVVLKH